MGFDGRLLSGMSVLAAVVETGSFTRAGDVLGPGHREPRAVADAQRDDDDGGGGERDHAQSHQ